MRNILGKVCVCVCVWGGGGGGGVENPCTCSELLSKSG